MSVNIVDRFELAPLISPQSNQRSAVHRWYSFKHGFSKDLVINLINHFNLKRNAWVLDPFCGSGTTLLTCRELGLNALGFDILPFSVYLSNRKVRYYYADLLLKQVEILKNTKSNVRNNQRCLPDIPLVNKAFGARIAEQLVTLKSRIDDIEEDEAKHFFNLAFLSILGSVSNTLNDGGFLRIVRRDINPHKIEELFFDKINSMIEDIQSDVVSSWNYRNSIKAKIGDARRLSTIRKFDAIITSPPYLNRHDYTRIYSLEMIFDFISTNQELKEIRYNTIRSHVEAKKRYSAPNYNEPPLIAELISAINTNGTNNTKVVAMIAGYFEDMYISLAEMSRCLKPKGKVSLVVSNVRFSGVTIPVDELLSEIGAQVGLRPIEIWAVRQRGNSSQQMRQYNRKLSRESVIIWEKLS
ncbi:DNA methyltransferase [Chloroflexota bacterium]